jgi:hypothetical protein
MSITKLVHIVVVGLVLQMFAAFAASGAIAQTGYRPPPGSPASREVDMTAAQMIKPGDMTPDELAYYKTIGPVEAKRFVATRSYVRICQQVVDHKIPALMLPKRPPGFTMIYVLQPEKKILDDALKDYLIADVPRWAH